MKKNKDKSAIEIKGQNAKYKTETSAEIEAQKNIDYAPKISIIIPVYNVEKYLRQCLDSVVNQTLREIEIICVDDGSTDSSLDILQEYAAKDKRIIIIKQNNQGAYPARNCGLDSAQGKYVGFIDSDDAIAPNYYQILYEDAEKYSAEIVITDNVYVKKNTKYNKKKLGITPEQTKISTVEEKGKIIVASGIMWNKIYRRDFIEKHHLRCLNLQAGGGDNYWTTLCLFYAKNIVVNHQARYDYILNDASITQSVKTRKNFVLFEVYQALEDELQQHTDNLEWLEWKKYINQRKLVDFKNYHNNMAEDCKDEFWQTALQKLQPTIIISLTSYPARINTVHQTIASLLAQTIKADKIILWLAEEQFLHKEKDLPPQLLALQNEGLEICWCHDIKSFKKLVPTLKNYPDAVVVTADDDVCYNKDWLEKMLLSYIMQPEAIHCHRAHYITFKDNKLLPYRQWIWKIKNHTALYNLIFTGVGGVLYPPHCLAQDVLDEKKFMNLCPQADDIWFWAMAVKNNTPIKVVENNITKLNFIDGTQENALWHSNVTDGQNDIQMQNVLREYPEIFDKLNKSAVSLDLLYHQSTVSYKLFSCIPLFTYQKQGRHKTYKILGLPVWKIRKMANNITTKCYCCGIPLLKISDK